MAIYGYARVSSTDQLLTIQIEALQAAGCEIVRAEKVSGTSLDNREELKTLLDFLRPGDTLKVTRIDRLARSMKDFVNVVAGLKDRGIAFEATEQPVSTSGPVGDLTMHILAACAQFETQLRRERQSEGIKAAKARGAYKGGKRKHDPAVIREMRAAGKRPIEIQRELGASKMTVRRALVGPI